MMRNTASLNHPKIPQTGWVAQAIFESATKSISYFVALMREAAARERDRRQLDERMLQDIGLEPFDIGCGSRGSGH